MGNTEQVQADEFDRALGGEAGRAAEFAPLVALAREAGELLAPPPPSAAFAARARGRLLQQARQARSSVRRGPATARRPLRLWQPAFIGLILVVALLGGSLGVAYAADDALPGEALYPAKRGLEQLRLALSGTPGSRASLRVHFASERLEEAEALLAAGRAAEASGLLGEYQHELSEMIDSAQRSDDAARFEGLQQALAAQQQVLLRLLEHSDEAGEKAAGEAIEEARHSQAVLEALLRGGNPSDLAPGHQPRGTDEPQGKPGEGQGQGQGQGAGRWHRTPSPVLP